MTQTHTDIHTYASSQKPNHFISLFKKLPEPTEGQELSGLRNENENEMVHIPRHTHNMRSTKHTTREAHILSYSAVYREKCAVCTLVYLGILVDKIQ